MTDTAPTRPWWAGLDCACPVRLQPWSPWHRPPCPIAQRAVTGREETAGRAAGGAVSAACGALRDVGVPAVGAGQGVVLSAAAAVALAGEVARLRTRLAAAEAPPY